MANFAVRLVHVLGWDSSRQIRDQDGWDEHAAFMDGLVDDSFIILGRPGSARVRFQAEELDGGVEKVTGRAADHGAFKRPVG